MSLPSPSLSDLDSRSREIFRRLVETYLNTGEPVGSRNIAKILPHSLSPASVRNTMQDLVDLGLIFSPHTSAGRLPTEQGLRFFVDGLMEVGDPSSEDRARIEAEVKAGMGKNYSEILSDATSLLSGLTRSASVVLTSKTAKRLKHIEFVRLESTRALVVLVGEDGSVENRIMPLPLGLPASALQEASNYLNARLANQSLTEFSAMLSGNRDMLQAELNSLTASLVEAGLASALPDENGSTRLIVRGQSNLLENLKAMEELERMRLLFADLETQSGLIDLLSRAENAEGVRIFIGSENRMFSLSGSSLIAAPFRDSEQRILGVIGIIGPTRLNYARIVPMVDFTAKLMGKVMEGR